MKVTVFSDFHCALDAQGQVCTTISIQPYSFWTRYLEAFDEVTVVARFSPRVFAGPAVTGPGVSFHAIPDYRSVRGYLREFPRIRRAIAAACAADSAFILRVPGRLGSLAATELLRNGRSYGAEIVGDPFEVLTRGAVRHPLRPVLRRYFRANLKRVASHAAAAAYVTEDALQRAYPTRGLSLPVSDVELPAEAIVADWKHADAHQHAFRIIMVGTLAQLYKAPDMLIEALARVTAHGLHVSVVFVGDGQFRSQLERQARSLELADRVSFRGQLASGAAVRAELDAADLFVLPSRGGEGLPRALVEAMARGLPCLGTRVGGIPELLCEDDLVEPDDSAALARKIEATLLEPGRRERMAERCWTRARAFDEATLRERRTTFFHAVRDTAAGRAYHTAV